LKYNITIIEPNLLNNLLYSRRS